MITLSMKDMLEVGAHFGHQRQRWNPKMRPYIYGERNGVHVINLQKTVSLFEKALGFVIETVANGGDLLFVGTKKQARDLVATEAGRAGMHYVNDRWMGGTLTNFKTIKASIDKLIDMETKREKGEYEAFTKKERLNIDRSIIKLSAALGGIRKLNGLPSALVIVDPKCERIAINEAKVLHIPIVALLDTNCDPDPIDYIIPANDDASRSIEYFITRLAEAALKGVEMRDERLKKRIEETKVLEEGKTAQRGRGVRVDKGTSAKAYVRGAKTDTAETLPPTDQGSYSASPEVPSEAPAPVLSETPAA